MSVRMMLLFLTVWVAAAGAQTEPPQPPGMMGDYRDGSQSQPVHHLSLYDAEGFRIFPGVNDNQPFSMRITCGKCHDVGTIGQGWHFEGGAQSGRPGEPWIFWDAGLATQISLSRRGWPGTFEPNQMGLSDWWFVQAFGRHMPGGFVGPDSETEAGADPHDNWAVSGAFEINCLTCHNGAATHDQAQVAEQTGRQNFAWSGTATCEFAHVTGTAQNPARTWEEGITAQEGPQVHYDPSRFFANNQVFMDIRKHVPNQRCLFCHSSKRLGGHGMQAARDVHLAAGMSCVDCHRHGLDHQMVRGYEQEAVDANDLNRFALSCRGCHLGAEKSKSPTAGQLTAPFPLHKGIPSIHFEKLSCTACHSGPWPEKKTVGVKTSRAHALGTRRVNRSEDTLPHIQMPVFASDTDGKLAPHRMMWPAYWGWLTGETVIPVPMDVIRETAAGILPCSVELESSSWPVLTEAMIVEVLGKLSAASARQPVYISGGTLSQVVNGALVTREHAAAAAVIWPMAHDVRPAAQSLSVRSCQDCHSAEAGMLFGTVALDGPLADPNERVAMAQYHGLDTTLNRLFAKTFVFRPMLKLVCILASFLISLVLLAFIVRAVWAVSQGLKN